MQPDAAPTPPAPVAAGSVSNTAVEVVSRPAPGTLARGLWEAPAWAFYASVAVVLLAAIGYLSGRAGLLRKRPAAK